jgi:hypothetical protein
MTLTYPPLLLFLVSGTLVAQQMSHPVMASRDDSFLSPRPAVTVAETLNVLAVMVQFQEDTDTRTTGNGRFDLSAPTAAVLDAPPHDRPFFESHMTFAESYFAKASKGRLVIRSTVIDQVLTLPSVMETYSPPRDGPNTAAANLAVVTWRMADSLGLVPDFSRYNCFVVFHAGTGRDIDLVNTLGYDPTPFDIPSLYFGLKAFRGFYGQDYPGIAVNGGAFHITSSIVLPESESRYLPGVTGDVLLELSTNGLLCASIGNHLGLPDLFDTRTGSSGIGRFGLMDGQAIFSFAGTFPPEPSAWEKYWLGWVQPITLEGGTSTVTLPATALADTVYRIPISAQEYYLIENRNRDPLGNGQTVTSFYNGAPVTQTFPRDTTNFYAYNVSALAGVVTSVEDEDWSLPGGIAEDGSLLDGGILIWHIDESVIAAGLASGTVNANPDRRGVDVEEADGSQDIGRSYGFLSAGSGSEEGTALDFWYAGNTAPVYRNEFSYTTHPPARSYSGAQAHITVKDFSARGARMTATVMLGDDVIRPVPGFPRRIGSPLTSIALASSPLVGSFRPALVLSTASGIFAWDDQGLPAIQGGGASGRVSATSTAAATGSTVADVNNDGYAELLQWEPAPGGQQGGTLRALTSRDLTGDSLADEIFTYTSGTSFSTVPVAVDSLIVVGMEGGRALVVSGSGVPRDSSAVNTVTPGSPITGIALLSRPGRFCCVSAAGTVSIVDYSQGAASILAERAFNGGFAGSPAVGRFSAGALRIVLVSPTGTVTMLDSTLQTVAGFPLETGPGVTTGAALGDVDGDGALDIVVASASALHAVNRGGFSLDHFPVVIRGGSPLTSNPVIGDLDGDGKAEVVAVTEDGVVVAYDGRGRSAPGFPLQAGTGTHAVMIAAALGDIVQSVDIYLAVASSDTSSVSFWRTGGSAGPIPAGLLPAWGQASGDAAHTGLALVPSVSAPLATEFFPSSRAYNWPNPVYDGSTFIRYYVNADASVAIKIFDLAGDLVSEMSGPGVGGIDNEVEWNVSGVKSGIYFARIEASGQGGSGVAVVKVAVVK